MVSARILVVEDNFIVGRDIREQLERMGHDVIGLATTAETAVDKAAAHRPDVVLMDIRLDGSMDGIDAARALRDMSIPVIFLTGYANEEIVERASSTDPFGYLLKPFEEPQLRTAIQMALYKKASEQRIRTGERRYEATLASIGDGVITCDAQARIDYINPVAEKLTGWTRAEAMGQPVETVFVTADELTHEVLRDQISTVMQTGQQVAIPRGLLLAESEIEIETTYAPIMADTGGVSGVVVVFRDMRQARRSAEALRAAQEDLAVASRLTLMGEFAAAIVHQVNQPLAAIMANAGACRQWLSRQIPDTVRAAAILEDITRDSQRAGEVIRSLSALAGRIPAESAPVAINPLIEETLVLIQSDIQRNRIKLITRLTHDLPPVSGDRVQLQQVLLNILTNAVDSLPDNRSGQIGISTERTREAVTISIEDNGPGVAGAVRDTLFDPLVTTKAKGMGMGLAISRTIVDHHGGEIRCEQASPEGSIFRISLPMSQVAVI